MELNCDTNKMRKINSELNKEISNFNDIIKDFYAVVDSITSKGWVGASALNYQKYLKSRRIKYNYLHHSMSVFSEVLNKNINELESAVSKSKVG